MLGRLRMTVSEAIQQYLKLGPLAFSLRHKVNILARLRDKVLANAAYDSQSLESAIKGLVTMQLSSNHCDDVLLEGPDRKCHM